MRRRRVLIALGLLAVTAVCAVVVLVPYWHEQARQQRARGRALLEYDDKVKPEIRLDELQAILGPPDRIEATRGGGQLAVWSGDTETGKVEIEAHFTGEGGIQKWTTSVSHLSTVDRLRLWLAQVLPWPF